jgi:hypothetical protein
VTPPGRSGTRLVGVDAGDIVEVQPPGRPRFFARVAASNGPRIGLLPLAGAALPSSYCRPADVLAHWRLAGPPALTDTPLEPSLLQLEFDTTERVKPR